MKKQKAPPTPPWVRDGNAHLWIRAGDFAKLMNRTRASVYNWYSDGSLKDFGYSYYRDIQGMLFIKITEEDRIGLDKIKRKARQYAQQAQA